jgi:uncharacterized protein YkwD
MAMGGRVAAEGAVLKLGILDAAKLTVRWGKFLLGVSALGFASLLLFASPARAQQNQSRTSSDQSNSGNSTQAPSQPRSRKHYVPLAKADGKWHSFSRSRIPARRSQPAASGWHHFGEAYSATYPSPSHVYRPARKTSTAAAQPQIKWHVIPPSESASPTVPAPAPAPSAPAAPASAASASATAPGTVPQPTYRSTETRSEAAPRRAETRSTYGAAKIAYLEREMFDLVNRDRRNHGSPPLRWNAKLAAVARAHSLDMIRKHYFGHVDPQGRTVAGRVTDADIAWQSVGENIAIAPSVTYAETEFMDEPHNQHNHRWNILNPGYTEVGVGIVRASDGSYYITQDFLNPQ